MVASVAVVGMVERFHYLWQFAGQPIDAKALDTLTTMVHRSLFEGGRAPTQFLAGDGASPVTKKSRTGGAKKS
jgi:hypothetical protein